MDNNNNENNDPNTRDNANNQSRNRDVSNTASDRSPVWEYFTLVMKDSVKYGKCNNCGLKYNIGTGTTSPLINHLKTKHEALWRQCEILMNKKRSRTTEGTSKKKKMMISTEEKKEIDELITEMIALDIEPYNIVNHRGFRKLLAKLLPGYEPADRTHISRKLMPELYKKVRVGLEKQLREDFTNGINSLLFTTDGWSSKTGHTYLSLTTHYMNTSYQLKVHTLGIRQLTERHTGIYLREILENLLTEWGLDDFPEIPKYFVTDNARNITSAVSSAGWTNVYCFDHTLNLTLKDAKKQIPELDELLGKVRRIVTHFHHSEPARRALRNAQLELGIKNPLKVVQMVDTRFNTEFYMLERVVELRKALAQAISNSRMKDTLSGLEWNEIEGLVKVLQPLTVATDFASGSKYPTLSMVIPLIRGIVVQLTKFIDKRDESLARNFSKKLLEAIPPRFPDEDPECQKATFLDPRFKDFFFTSDVCAEVQKSIITEIESEFSSSGSQHSSGETQGSSHSQQSQRSDSSDFWSFMNLPRSTSVSSSNVKTTTRDEIMSFLRFPRTDQKSNPLNWWHDNAAAFPNLGFLARRYLSIPAASTESERLFSTSGQIANDDRRANLTAENVEILVFLNKNL